MKFTAANTIGGIVGLSLKREKELTTGFKKKFVGTEGKWSVILNQAYKDLKIEGEAEAFFLGALWTRAHELGNFDKKETMMKLLSYLRK